MAVITYENPQNGYKESFSTVWAFIVTLLLAPVYFLIKGEWGHAVASLLLAVGTAGLSSIIYAFLASGIVRRHYARKGWKEVANVVTV